MELSLYVKEDEGFKILKVPYYIVNDLLRDRLSRSELDRINRLAEKIAPPLKFPAGSVVIDFSDKTAQCFNAKVNIEDLEPTWLVKVEKVTLHNY